MEDSPPAETSEFNNREQFQYLKICNKNQGSIYSPTDIAMESDFSFWTSQVKQLLRQMESLETENNKLRSEIHSLSARVSEVEGDNLSLKKIIHENKEQESLHPQNDVLHAEILDLKSKQEEIRSQQATFKQETETHINSWAQVVRGKDRAPPPPLLQQSRRWCRLNSWRSAPEGQGN
jgi:predicted RNase H-like nuclease (RuvC/YqgF family)